MLNILCSIAPFLCQSSKCNNDTRAPNFVWVSEGILARCEWLKFSVFVKLRGDICIMIQKRQKKKKKKTERRFKSLSKKPRWYKSSIPVDCCAYVNILFSVISTLTKSFNIKERAKRFEILILVGWLSYLLSLRDLFYICKPYTITVSPLEGYQIPTYHTVHGILMSKLGFCAHMFELDMVQLPSTIVSTLFHAHGTIFVLHK